MRGVSLHRQQRLNRGIWIVGWFELGNKGHKLDVNGGEKIQADIFGKGEMDSRETVGSHLHITRQVVLLVWSSNEEEEEGGRGRKRNKDEVFGIW